MQSEKELSLAEAINKAQEKYLQEKIYRARWKSNRASGLGDVCTRRLFYYRTCGELAEEINTHLAAIFEEGKDQEPVVRRYLSELGFEIMRTQATAEWPEYQISGSVDGIYQWGEQRYIVEIKTVSSFAWDKLKTIEDFNEGFYRKWFAQMQIYMILFGYENGIFILKNKEAKELRVIETTLDYGYAEGLLKKAEHINQAIESNAPPEYINNPVECKRCPFFGKVCNPPMDFGTMSVIEDDELADKLAKRDSLDPLRKEFDALDKEVKERFREIPDAICGNYHITGSPSILRIKATEAREVPTWRVKIEKIQEQAATQP
jgi:CRISPR/Cas system-associated exonuclease Cas4 (RecB family)